MLSIMADMLRCPRECKRVITQRHFHAFCQEKIAKNVRISLNRYDEPDPLKKHIGPLITYMKVSTPSLSTSTAMTRMSCFLIVMMMIKTYAVICIIIPPIIYLFSVVICTNLLTHFYKNAYRM